MIVYHPSAEQELIDSAAYYESNLEGLGEEFLTAIDHALDSIEESPLAYYFSHPDLTMRRYPVKRFPFFLYYRISNELIEVFAVAHQSKRPDYWTGRP